MNTDVTAIPLGIEDYDAARSVLGEQVLDDFNDLAADYSFRINDVLVKANLTATGVAYDYLIFGESGDYLGLLRQDAKSQGFKYFTTTNRMFDRGPAVHIA